MEQEKALSQAFSFQASHLRLTKFLENTVSCVRKLNLCKVAELSSNHTNIAWQCYYLTPVVSNTTYPKSHLSCHFMYQSKFSTLEPVRNFFPRGWDKKRARKRRERRDSRGGRRIIEKSREWRERILSHPGNHLSSPSLSFFTCNRNDKMCLRYSEKSMGSIQRLQSSFS